MGSVIFVLYHQMDKLHFARLPDYYPSCLYPNGKKILVKVIILICTVILRLRNSLNSWPMNPRILRACTTSFIILENFSAVVSLGWVLTTVHNHVVVMVERTDLILKLTQNHSSSCTKRHQLQSDQSSNQNRISMNCYHLLLNYAMVLIISRLSNWSSYLQCSVCCLSSFASLHH